MKSLIIDFLNYIFFLVIVSFFILYFIIGDRFETFTAVLKSLFPVGIFALVLLAKMIKSKREIKKSDNDDDDEIIIYLSTRDKLINDLIIYSSPIIILLIAFFLNQINKIDIFQATIIFIMLASWNLYIFSKR